jgi:predicted ester cyclase
MKPEEMKEVLRKVIEEGFNKGDTAVLDEAFHKDYVRYADAGLKGVKSLAEHKADILDRHRTFSDARLAIEDMVADGDCVAVRFLFTGKHVGPFLGIPATGKLVSRETAAFFHFRDGKVIDGHLIGDSYGLLQQLRGEA